jgi:hypothetical protein
MRKSLLLYAAFACFWPGVRSAEAQNPERFNYAAYNPVTSGIFANFTYPARSLFEGAVAANRRKSFSLTDGIFRPRFNDRGYIERLGAYLKSVEFVDVTSDRQKEAIVVIGNLCDCSGQWFGIYIYQLAASKPVRLLWAFQTGDRAIGGLRQVYGRNGQLVVELYGSGSGPNFPPKNYGGAVCCTYDYTKRRYKWNGSHFVQKGKARLLSEREV